MLKSVLCSILMVTGTMAYHNKTLEQMVEEQTQNERILGISLNPKEYFDELLNLPESFIQDLLNVGNLKPPIKLASATKVKTPSKSEVKRHWSHATFSYCVLSKIVDYKCLIGCPDYKVTKTFENFRLGTFAIAGYEPTTKEIIISHRGTMNIRNWLRDFSYGKVKMPNAPEGVLIHEGFAGVYKSNANDVNAYLMSMLDDPKFKGYKVVFTGHSLGGAVATLNAIDMASKVKAKGFQVELYSYHAPRVGNQAFVDYAVKQDITIGRYTNRGDLVSHGFPRQYDYVHVPGEFHTDFSDLSGRSFRECSQDYDEDPTCGYKEYKNIWLLDHAVGFGQLVNFIC